LTTDGCALAIDARAAEALEPTATRATQAAPASDALLADSRRRA
jgi:hypothetical protein